MALSPAFKRFELRLAEVSHLRRLCARYNSIKHTTGLDKAGHARALIRGATVLLSGHIQGYVEDLADYLVKCAIASSLDSNKITDRFRYFAMKRDFEELRSLTDHEKIVKKVRIMGQHRASMFDLQGTLSNDFLNSSYKDGFGNPTSDEIAKFCRRFGLEDLKSQLKPLLGGNWFFSINAVDQIIDRRTKIAHGDHLATLTAAELLAYSTLVRAFCAGTDRVMCRHFKAMGCAL